MGNHIFCVSQSPSAHSSARSPPILFQTLVFGIWIGNITTDWQSLCDDVNDFGILTWDTEDDPPARLVNFLDLPLTIKDQNIVTKTFQKKMDLFLYLPASSAHPQGCLKGTIYSLFSWYYAQNIYQKDYIFFVEKLLQPA